MPTPDRPRRSPNFARFIVTGAVLGFVVGAFVAWLRRDMASELNAQLQYDLGAAVGYVGLLGACLGALLLAAVAVLLDRRNRD